jgi:hypothetical protein
MSLMGFEPIRNKDPVNLEFTEFTNFSTDMGMIGFEPIINSTKNYCHTIRPHQINDGINCRTAQKSK